jgi:hypothetical protein
MFESRAEWRNRNREPMEQGIRATSKAAWVREKLGFEPDAVQARLLDSASTQVILNCTRQWGKSTVTAAKAVHHAYTQPESLTLAVSPSARQSEGFPTGPGRYTFEEPYLLRTTRRTRSGLDTFHPRIRLEGLRWQ